MQDHSATAVRPLRPPQDNIPQTRHQRDVLTRTVAEYVERQNPVTPLSVDELRSHAAAVLDKTALGPKYLDYAAVLISNEVWRQTVAGIPFEKRILLLPKCLRSSTQCRAEFDQIGLVCEHCGACIIDQFKTQAERLGYAVLITEGSPVVMSLIETGKVEAVIGVSCLSVLEKVFPYMEAGAVPGIAIPLLQDGCSNTSVDADQVWDAIYHSSDDRAHRLNLDDLRSRTNNCFTNESLADLLTPVEDQTEELALKWMAKVGKRWRPFLAACTYRALAQNSDDEFPLALRKAAVAVECFHKASLVHDDIEDADELRYGEKTLHAEYGIPIALNVGDFLLGEGYRLLVEIDAPDDCKTKMLAAAVRGHRSLCLGQGKELSWIRKPRPLSVSEVIDIFRKKTSPAFEVALKLGAILTRCDDELNGVFEQYSQALGIAYQIRDDIEDFRSTDEHSDALGAMRPSLLLALAHERASEGQKELLDAVWTRSARPESLVKDVTDLLDELKVEHLASDLMESHKSKAIGCLYQLKNSRLKGLLRRVIGKIFDDFEVMGCCNDHKAGNDQDRGSGAPSSR